MRTRENELLYTSKHTFAGLKETLDRGDKERVIRMFEQRVKELYLEPARLLIEHPECRRNDIGSLFSAGLICVSTIDFLGRFYMGCPEKDVGSRFICWLLSYMRPPFNGYLAKRFYEDFRNGLVHECRIKNGGEFSLNKGETIKGEVDDNGVRYLVVNPEKLLKKLEDGFKNYLDDLQQDEDMFRQFVECLKKDFKEDFRKGDDSNER